jgi:glycosyltransferase involved in cell wall biosynthesis
MGHMATSEGRLSVACIATCPPRQCGIATFSSDLAAAMRRIEPGLELAFGAIIIDGCEPAGGDVRWIVRQGDAASYRRLAVRINEDRVDVVLLQHEFGLYGHWGPVFDDHLAGFLEEVDAPVVTTLHSVPADPSPSVRGAVARIARRSAAITVMGASARRLLLREYGVDPSIVRVILHGVPAAPAASRASIRAELGVGAAPLVTTFGFLDPRKGLEHMIDAMVPVTRRVPETRYVVIGRTHPELARREGEAYRDALSERAARAGLGASVSFVDGFVSLETIVRYLCATDVYVTPYLDLHQVTSGTLSYALGLGRAVVSTPYVHALEALAGGRGLIVPRRDPAALAAAVGSLLERPGYRGRIERRAAIYGARMAWPRVAADTLGVLRRAASGAAARGPIGTASRARASALPA